MEPIDDDSFTPKRNGYGAISEESSNPCDSGSDHILDINDLMTHQMNERYIKRIRQQCKVTNGPAMVNWQVARSKRRPIVRAKSEPNFGAWIDQDIETVRAKLVKHYGKNHQRFVFKGLPNFTRRQWLVLGTLALVDFTSFCAMSILAPFFPSEAAAKGVTTSISGLVFSVYALVVFLASPLMGVVVGQVGPKFLLILGVFLGGACNLLFGVLDQIESTPIFITYCFLVRIFEALGAAAFATSSYTLVARIFPDNIGTVLGILETFVGLGLAAGPAIGGLLYDIGGYALPFCTLGVVMIATIPVNMALLPPTDCYDDSSENKGSILQLLRIPPILVICLVVIVASNTWGFLDPTLSIHLAEFNLSAKELGLFFLLNSFLYAASSPLWGFVADKMDRTWILMFHGLILNTIGLLLLGPSPFLPLTNTIWLNIVSLIVLGTSIAMCLLPTFEAILDLALDSDYPDDTVTYGLIAGLWSSVYSFGEVMGPSLGGFLLETYDFPIASSAMAAISLSLAIMVLLYFCTIQSPYDSQLSQSSKDSRDQTTDWDSGISDNPPGVTSRSTSSSSLDIQSQSRTSTASVNENTPLLLSQSYDERDSRRDLEDSCKYNSGFESSFGSFPDILKTISITGAGAVEV